MNENTIYRSDVREFIQKEIGEGFFGVTFTKRTSGEIRNMTCRLNVRKHLKGGQLNYDPKRKGLLMVYSMDARGYRSVPLESLTEIRANGITYQVV